MYITMFHQLTEKLICMWCYIYNNFTSCSSWCTAELDSKELVNTTYNLTLFWMHYMCLCYFTTIHPTALQSHWWRQKSTINRACCLHEDNCGFLFVLFHVTIHTIYKILLLLNYKIGLYDIFTQCNYLYYFSSKYARNIKFIHFAARFHSSFAGAHA